MSDKPQRIPGRTFYQYEDDDTFYIYSSLDKIVLTTDNTKTSDTLVYIDIKKNIKIYADTVQLNGNLKLNPHRSFTLFAREIHCLLPGATYISSNGKSGDDLQHRPPKNGAASRGSDGANQGGNSYWCKENAQDASDGAHATEPVRDGVSGEKGGTIVICASKLCLPDKNSRLILEARGGAGQQGQDGQDGGDGGNGFYRLCTCNSHLAYQSGYGGRGGNATYGGKGGNGGPGGESAICVESIPFGRLGQNHDGGKKGLKGIPGKPGVGGRHSNDRSSRVFEFSVPNLYGPDSTYWRSWCGRSHNNGRDGQENGTTKAQDGGFNNSENQDGQGGKLGSVENHYNPDKIVSATHLLMMLERAKAMHLIASLQVTPEPTVKEKFIKSLNEVCTLLDWIIRRSQWVNSDKGLKNASRNPLEVEAFRDIHNTAARLKNYAGNGLNPFGESALEPVVPNLSYDFLGSILNDELDQLNDIKKQYDEILSAKDEDRNAQVAFSKRTNTNKATQLLAEAKKAKCWEDLKETADNLETTNKTLVILKAQLIQKADAFEKAVTSFQFPTWEELINAVTMTAFAKPLAIVEGIDLFAKGLTEVSEDDGTKINKKFIIRKTMTIKDDLQKSLKTSYDSVTGAIQPGDQGIILADLEQYDKMVQKFQDFAAAKELHKLIQNFFDIVSQRNDYIMQYNTLLLQISKIDGQLDNLKAEQDQNLENMSKLNDPAVAYLAASLARRYSMALEDCAHQISILERAYRYSTLEETSKIFQDLFCVDIAWGGNDDILYQLTPGSLKDCKESLVKAYRDHLNNQTNPPARYPAKESDDGLLLTLKPNETGSFEFLAEENVGYRFNFHIVRSKNETETDSGHYYLPALADFYDIRLLINNGVSLRVYLEGGEVPDNISAVLIHGSLDTIYSKNSRKLKYRLKSNIPFPIITTPRTSIKKLQGQADGHSVETYRQVGIYTNWSLLFPTRNGANPTLDLTKIRKLQIEFSVTYRR